MRMSAGQWHRLMGVGADEVIGHEVGAVFSTDIAEYADRVDASITQLHTDIEARFDVDISAPPEKRLGAPTFDRFRFLAQWLNYTGDNCVPAEDDPNQEDGCAFNAFTTPPIGWKQFRRFLGSGRMLDLGGAEPDVMREIGLYEEWYVRFRQEFVNQGGDTSSEVPAHPGVFKSASDLEKERANATDWGTVAKVGLVLLGIGVVGYTATGVARLKGS